MVNLSVVSFLIYHAKLEQSMRCIEWDQDLINYGFFQLRTRLDRLRPISFKSVFFLLSTFNTFLFLGWFFIFRGTTL